MDWLLALVDDGRLVDVDGATIDFGDGVRAEAFAQDDCVLVGTAKVGGIDVAVFAQELSHKRQGKRVLPEAGALS